MAYSEKWWAIMSEESERCFQRMIGSGPWLLATKEQAQQEINLRVNDKTIDAKDFRVVRVRVEEIDDGED